MAKKVAGESAKVPSWRHGEYPFDVATCGACLTLHAFGICSKTGHNEIRKAVREESRMDYPSRDWAESHLDICLKLRKRFARFYPKASKP